MQSFLVGALLAATTALAPPHAAAPARSPQGLENRYWAWRGQTIRYQVMEPEHPTGQTALLVHGLFVNADHWRKTLRALGDAGVTAYAVDLLGSGWSSKPHPTSSEAPNGEAGRAELEGSDFFEGVELGSANGKLREVAFVVPADVGIPNTQGPVLPADHWKYESLYGRLGLPEGSHRDLVKAHFRKLALRYHPDRVTGVAEKFQGISDAYLALMK